MPLANAYLASDQLDAPEKQYPLRVNVCNRCWLVQADAFVPPEDIFSHYQYFSSFSDSWVEHARRFVEMAQRKFELSKNSQVIEVASNDGYLLQHFVLAGVPVLGVEPAANVAEVARSRGIPTEIRFFGREAALDLAARGYAADLVICNNVLAHVPDINDFVAGIARILKTNGVVSFEFPHLLRLIEGLQFDTVYHEHFYYLSLLSVENVLGAHGLFVFDVEELQTHGGSIRVFAALDQREEAAGLKKVRRDELAAGLIEPAVYHDFERRLEPIRGGLVAFLNKERDKGKRVAAYGAAAKGNTLLNFCRLGSDMIDYVVDRNPHKQGLFLPGSRLPILSPETLSVTKPDYILILPWNIKDEIIASYGAVRSWGGRFVIAVPELTIIS